MLGPDPTFLQTRIRIRSLVSKRAHFSAVVWTIFGEEWYHTNRFHTNQNAAYQLHELHDESNVEYISGIKPHFEILIISYSEKLQQIFIYRENQPNIIFISFMPTPGAYRVFFSGLDEEQ